MRYPASIGLFLALLVLLPATAWGAAPYKLLAWGDCRPWTTSGTAVSTGLKVIVPALRGEHADRALAGGDYVELDAGDPTATIAAKYDAFFATYRRVGVPTDYVMGNHEAVSADARAVYDRRVHAVPGYYTAARGPFRVIVLNTNEPGYPGHIGFYGVGDPRNSAQADWLVRALRAVAGKRAWIVVALHHPLLDPEDDAAFATTSRVERDGLVRLFDRYGVDLVLQGDVHNYRRHRRADGADYVTEGMGGAPPHPVSAAPTDVRDVKTLGSSTDDPRYGYVTVAMNASGTVTGRMFWMKPGDGGKRHLGDRWRLRQIVRTAP